MTSRTAENSSLRSVPVLHVATALNPPQRFAASIGLVLLVACSSGSGASTSDAAGAPSAGGSASGAGALPAGAPGSGGVTGNAGTLGSAGLSPGGAATSGTGNDGGSSSNGGAGASAGAGASDSGGVIDSGGGGAKTGVPGVRIVGRTAPGTAGTKFEWSGSSVSARFVGTQVSAQISDGNNGNSFEVVIDGAMPKKVFTTAGQTTLTLAIGLTSGTHDLLLWKDTEANVGATEFIGLTDFGTGGMLLAPAPAPARRIEIVGDSFSCGAGIEGTGTCTGSGSKIENHYLSYGAIAAREVLADLVTIAWSGIGVFRNYGKTTPTPATVIPAYYDYAIPTEKAAWDFSKYQPDVVVMNLTNNDFSTGDPGQPYIDAYLALTKHIRAKYPSAQFIHVIEWKTGSATDQTAQTALNKIVVMLQAGGDMKHAIFDMRPYANTKECGGHPDLAASQAMGDALAAELRKVLAW